MSRWNPLDLLRTAIGFGLLAGAGEVIAQTIRQRLMDRTLFLGPDYLWQLPVADAAIFLAVGLLLLLCSIPWPALRAPRVAIAVFGALAALSMLLLTERVHIVAKGFPGGCDRSGAEPDAGASRRRSSQKPPDRCAGGPRASDRARGCRTAPALSCRAARPRLPPDRSGPSQYPAARAGYCQGLESRFVWIRPADHPPHLQGLGTARSAVRAGAGCRRRGPPSPMG